MSAAIPVSIYLDLKANSLACEGREARFSHHKAALFLAGLIAAAGQGGGLLKADFVLMWAAHDATAAPDATAIRRVIQAVRRALDHVLPDGAQRLEVQARKLTLGPWRFVQLPHETWHVLRGQAVQPEPVPSLLSTQDVLAWCELAHDLAFADSDIRENQYGLACKRLMERRQSHLLSDECWCLWTLRLIWVLRARGELAAARRELNALQCRLPGLSAWRVRAFMQAKAALLAARMEFDETPFMVSSSLDAEKMRALVDAAPSAAMQWEWCNLQASMLKRQLSLQLTLQQAGEARPARTQELANEMLQAFGAAYFWAALDKDAYHCQAIACNLAAALHELTRKGLLCDPRASIAWMKQAHNLVAYFGLVQDSAWDFLILGDVYLDSPAGRAMIDEDAGAWTELISPADEKFYIRSLELAHAHGNARQQIIALDQWAKYLRLHGLVSRMQEACARRDALMSQHPLLVKDLRKDGFIPCEDSHV